MRLLKEIAFAATLTFSSFYNITTGQAYDTTLGNLVIENPWSRETAAAADVGAGFMTITNTGAEDDRLIKATAEISDMVQLHNMKMENDMMTMFEMKEGIVIPSGQTVELKPKSLHVMFMNLKAHPQTGDAFKATLTFERAGTVEIEFAVETADAGMQ
jgi:copper(I)-binding protein